MWYDAVLQFGRRLQTRLAYRHIANGIGINRRTPARCRSSGHPHATRTSCFPRPRKRASNACGWVCGVICSRWNNSRNSRGKSHAAFSSGSPIQVPRSFPGRDRYSSIQEACARSQTRSCSCSGWDLTSRLRFPSRNSLNVTVHILSYAA